MKKSARHQFGDWLKQASRWLLAALLVYAPLAFGCTRPETKDFLRWTLLVVTLLFAGRLVGGNFPGLPRLALGLSLGLLAYGWFMALNSHQEFDPALYRFFDCPQLIPGLPGAVDRPTTVSTMLLISGMFGAFWVACNAAAHRTWRNRFWAVMGLTGAALMVFGLASRFTGLDVILFQSNYAFATFRYHANAGAFINLALPLLVYRAIRAIDEKGSSAEKTFWSLSALLTAACGFINVSRAASLITLLLLIGIALEQAFRRWPGNRHFRKFAGGLLLVTTLLVVLGWSLGLERAWDRWVGFSQQIADPLNNGRSLVYAAIWNNALPISGWWGLGPGTFQISFPFFCQDLGARIAGIWRYAHQDYLQTLMEWGWIGMILWVALFFGGVARGLKRIRLHPKNRHLDTACLFVLFGLGIHSAVDFPLQIASLQLYTAVCLGFLWRQEKAPPQTMNSICPITEAMRR